MFRYGVSVVRGNVHDGLHGVWTRPVWRQPGVAVIRRTGHTTGGEASNHQVAEKSSCKASWELNYIFVCYLAGISNRVVHCCPFVAIFPNSFQVYHLLSPSFHVLLPFWGLPHCLFSWESCQLIDSRFYLYFGSHDFTMNYGDKTLL